MGNYVIYDVKDFDLEQTLECGQCFRFYKLGYNEYIIVARGKMLRIKQEEGTVIFFDTDKNEYDEIWSDYFDLNRDYSAIKKYLLKNDEKLKEAIETKHGVRILNQEFFEIIISFIISQNKQIPHIKKIVEMISEKYGDKVGEYDGKVYYSFPTVEQLANASEEDFLELKTGFRAKYLVDAISKIKNNIICENELANMTTLDAEVKLQEIKGVGTKVANCVLLFGLGRREAFPIDVWIKRIMEKLYFGEETSKEIIQKFADESFGEYGGYAQQYLFYYARDNKIKENKR